MKYKSYRYIKSSIKIILKSLKIIPQIKINGMVDYAHCHLRSSNQIFVILEVHENSDILLFLLYIGILIFAKKIFDNHHAYHRRSVIKINSREDYYLMSYNQHHQQ